MEYKNNNNDDKNEGKFELGTLKKLHTTGAIDLIWTALLRLCE